MNWASWLGRSHCLQQHRLAHTPHADKHRRGWQPTVQSRDRQGLVDILKDLIATGEDGRDRAPDPSGTRPAEPSDHVALAYRGEQNLGNLREDTVACRMAGGVVNGLETVEVDQQEAPGRE